MNHVDLLGHRKQNPSNRGPCNALRTIANPAIEETQQTRSNHTKSTGGCGPVAQKICQNQYNRTLCMSIPHGKCQAGKKNQHEKNI